MSEGDRENFADQYGPWAVIAGASDGIGEAFAREIAARGVNVVLLARRKAVLERVAAAIRDECGVETRVIVADLTSDDMETQVADRTEGLEIGLLVYNAGAVHAAKKFLERPVGDAHTLIALNCTGPVALAHRFGQGMRERGRGGIVLLSSVAALSGSSYTAGYASTKAFDLILAESLWHELAPEGVQVLGAIVGATRTPSMLASNSSFEAYPNIMEPPDVAKGALDHLGTGPVWVAGKANRETVAQLWPTRRVEVINGTSAATAGLYDLPHVAVEGEDFHDM